MMSGANKKASKSSPMVNILRDLFFIRTDWVCFLASWGLPCPTEIDSEKRLVSLLASHVLGDEAPDIGARYHIEKKDGEVSRGTALGPHRIGTYMPGPEKTVICSCVDIDGGGDHSSPVSDPLLAAKRIMDNAKGLGVASHLVSSGSATGYHVWCFYSEPVSAALAKEFWHSVIPGDIPLIGGGFAKAESCEGIEVFPKQVRVTPPSEKNPRGGVGNQVWLPAWAGAARGGSKFLRLEDGDPVEWVPASTDDFVRNKPSALEHGVNFFRELAGETTASEEMGQPGKSEPTVVHMPGKAVSQASDWTAWRSAAIEELDLKSFYADILTGEDSGSGWLEARDPRSPSGDRTPSSGVADGTGEAPKGTFHSFRDQVSLSPFDYLIETGAAKGFGDAAKQIAIASGVPLPERQSTNPSDLPDDYDPEIWRYPGIRRFNDLGNAYRLVDRHGDKIRYCAPWDSWLVWDGRRWKKDEESRVLALASETVSSIFSESDVVQGDDEDSKKIRSAIFQHAERSGNASKIAGMVNVARGLPGISVTPSNFDAHPFLFNCMNGTVDLTTGVLRPHDPADSITQLSNVTFDHDAECPRFSAFMERIFLGQHDLIAYIQQVFGYSLTGLPAQSLHFFVGDGANGKSVLLQVVSSILSDYAGESPPNLLLMKKHDPHPEEIANLRGLRFVTSEEVSERSRLDEGKVKRLTSGRPVKARHMHGRFFEFMPSHKFFMAVNHRPKISGSDHGIWRRIKQVPFDYRIPESEQREFDEVVDEFLAESPGIFRWMVAGCLAWVENGKRLEEPEQVKAAISSYHDSMDRVGQFLEDCTEQPAANTSDYYDSPVKSSTLYKAFKAWWLEQGERGAVPTNKEFTSDLKRRGFEGKKISTWHWFGILLLDDRPGVTSWDDL